MSWCRVCGSRGDSQAKISESSSAIVQFFHTLLKESLILKESILPLIWCSDIFRYFGVLKIVGDDSQVVYYCRVGRCNPQGVEKSGGDGEPRAS